LNFDPIHILTNTLPFINVVLIKPERKGRHTWKPVFNKTIRHNCIPVDVAYCIVYFTSIEESESHKK